MYHELAGCQVKRPPQYNHACIDSKAINPDCKGRLFAHSPGGGAGPAQRVEDELSKVPEQVYTLHISLSSALFSKSSS